MGVEWLSVLDPKDITDPKPDTSEKPDESANRPANIYLQGHLSIKDGFELERAGKFEAALGKLREARKLFDATYEADPKWNIEIVEYRRRKILEDIARVEKLAAEKLRHVSEPVPVDPIGKPPEPGDRFPDKLDERKQPRSDKQRRQAKKDRTDRSDALRDGQKPEREGLRRQLHEMEQAIQAARRREEALRAVIRDLLNEMEATQSPGQRRRPMMQPPADPAHNFNPNLPDTPVAPAAPPPPAAPPR